MSTPIDEDCCFQSSPPFTAPTPGNAHLHDYSGGGLDFVKSWDSSHAYASSVMPVGDSLIVCGHGNSASVVNSALDGVAVRFDEFKTEEWNTASYLYGSYYSTSAGKWWGAIDASGTSWLYAGTSAGSLSDIQVSSSGSVSAGVSGAKGRIWPSRFDTTFATTDDSGDIYLRDASGSVSWSKSVGGHIVDAAVTPSGRIWIQRFYQPIATWTHRIELHSSGALVLAITVTSGGSTLADVRGIRSLASFSDESCAVSWLSPAGTTSWFRRYSDSSATPLWDRNANFYGVCVDETDKLFAAGSFNVSRAYYLDASTGDTIVAAAPYKSAFDASMNAYAEDGQLWTCGKRLAF